MNIMRHCALARSLGADAFMATESGRDTYGSIPGIPQLPFVAWSSRRTDDVCIVPDIYTSLIDEIPGWVVAYEQNPLWIRNDFDHRRDRVVVWTDSPRMLDLCRRHFPGKDIPIVPNIVDHETFRFVPQSERRRGELIAFPRKGPEFIRDAFAAYRAAGGAYWSLELVDGLTLGELGVRFRTPQAFLASADFEGCALPPQEAMASGIAVVGKDANGANFCMRHDETALVADTPEGVARALVELEDDLLRDRLSRAGSRYIQRYSPGQAPTEFWREAIASPRWSL